MMLDYYPTNIVDFIDYFQILLREIDKIYIWRCRYNPLAYRRRAWKTGIIVRNIVYLQGYTGWICLLFPWYFNSN